MENNDPKDETPAKYEPFSIRRYSLNVIVRLLFFLFPIPTYGIFNFSSSYGSPFDYRISLEIIPLGIAIIFFGVIIGAIFDILLPKDNLLGGKIAIGAFNLGTLSKFEDIKFNIEVGASGKGISIKDKKE